jgi:hypothetical protein
MLVRLVLRPVVLRLLTAACLLATLAPLSTGVLAQPATEESTEDATILLMPYLYAPSDVPAGYTLDETTAYPPEAQAFEAVMIPPPDSRPMGTILNMFTDTGRIIRLRQGFASDDEDAPDLALVIAAFRDNQGAAGALTNPGLLEFVQPDAQVASLATPALPFAVDGAAAFTIDQTLDVDAGPERTVMLAWQRGRLAFSVTATGEPDSITPALLVNLAEMATRTDTRAASQPALPAQFPMSPAFMATAQRRLELYQALADRLLPDDALGADYNTNQGVSAIPNALMVLDSTIAEAPVNDPKFVKDRLLTSERHILGVSKRFQPANTDDDDPATQFPAVAIGHHVYADADGAREAFGAPVSEMRLRINEEVYLLNDPKRQPFSDATPTLSLGEQTRTMTARIKLDDGPSIDVTSVRWRRGAVELYANVAVVAGKDASALVRQVVEGLDAAYTKQPLPGS